MMKSFKDKSIWIIGASSGIGAALAREIASKGATLALSARSEDKLKEVKKSLSGDGHKVYPLDVADTEKVGEVTEKVKQELGNIDSIIFMAANYKPHSKDEQDINQVKQIVDVNLTGALNVAHFALPILRKQKTSQLALCGSIAGYRGLPNGQPYCATKAAIISLAESLHVENKKYGVDVKLISPGFVKTPLTDKNDFDMPFIMEAEEAAKRICKGLKSNSFEIHFPKRFTLTLKFLQFLPNWLYLKLMKIVDKKV